MIRTGDIIAKSRDLPKKGKIFTTRDINVSLDDTPKKLGIETTKNIEVKYIDKDGPPEAPKGPMVTTHNVEDFVKETKAKEKMTKVRAGKVEKKVIVKVKKEESIVKSKVKEKRVIKRK